MDVYIKELVSELKKQNADDEYILLVTKYANNLLKQGLPVIFDLAHFSMLIKDINDSVTIFLDTTQYYKKISIPKNNGDSRLLIIPDEKLKKIQRWILKNILENIPISKNSKGFKKGLSIIDHAKDHTNKYCVLSIDFKDFFPSVSCERVYKLFYNLGYTSEVSKSLSLICTFEGILPQGAPTSPYIANLVCSDLDNQLDDFFSDKEVAYSRYADDLTFSANKDLKKFINLIEEIVKKNGFDINFKKTRVKYKHQRQLVTGLVVNNNKPSIPRKLKRRLKQEIYYCKRYGVHGHLTMDKSTIKYYSNYKNHLFGLAYYFKMIDEKTGQMFIEELKEIPWEY